MGTVETIVSFYLFQITMSEQELEVYDDVGQPNDEDGNVELPADGNVEQPVDGNVDQPEVGNDEQPEGGKKKRRNRAQEEVLGEHTKPRKRAHYGVTIPKFSFWTELAVHMALQRTLNFFTFLYYCKTEEWLKERIIVGGSTSVQDAPVGAKKKNQPFKDNDLTLRPNTYEPSEYSHYVQADIKDVAFNDWPPFVKRLLGSTRRVPKVWNQSIDRSIDHIQKQYINILLNEEDENKKAELDIEFVKAFLRDVIKRIHEDNKKGKPKWYEQMHEDDIAAQLATFEELLDEENADWLDCITNNEALPADVQDDLSYWIQFKNLMSTTYEEDNSSTSMEPMEDQEPMSSTENIENTQDDLSILISQMIQFHFNNVDGKDQDDEDLNGEELDGEDLDGDEESM